MAERYDWRGESSIDGSPPLGMVAGAGSWAECFEMISVNLNGLSIAYPASRAEIHRLKNELKRLSPGDWDGSFHVEDLPYRPLVHFSVKKESRNAMYIRPADPEPPPKPRLRAGNDERRRYQEHLTAMYADGRLTGEEFDARYGRLVACRYVDELPAVIEELPPLSPLSPQETEEKRDPVVPGLQPYEVEARLQEVYKREGTMVVPLVVGIILSVIGQNIPGGPSLPVTAAGSALILLAMVIAIVSIIRR